MFDRNWTLPFSGSFNASLMPVALRKFPRRLNRGLKEAQKDLAGQSSSLAPMTAVCKV